MIGWLVAGALLLYLFSRGSAQNQGILYPSSTSSLETAFSSQRTIATAAGIAQSIADATALAAAPTLAPPTSGGTSSQPVTMDASTWASFKAQVIAKYVGPAPRGKYQQSSSYHAWYDSCIEARQLTDLKTSEGVIPSTCGSAVKPGSLLTADLQARNVAALGQAGAGAAVNIASHVGTSIPGAITTAIPIIGTAISLVTSAIAIFGAAHQAAMTKEKDYLCAYIPSANQALQIIDEQYRNGSIGGDQARQDLENLWKSWLLGIAPIARPPATEYSTDLTSIGTGGTCNAACAFSLALRMIIDVREQVDY